MSNRVKYLQFDILMHPKRLNALGNYSIVEIHSKPSKTLIKCGYELLDTRHAELIYDYRINVLDTNATIADLLQFEEIVNHRVGQGIINLVMKKV